MPDPTITEAHIDAAIAVRRGERRIIDLPTADRAAVTSVLKRTSDARLATTILEGRAPRGRAWHSPRSRFTNLRRE